MESLGWKKKVVADATVAAMGSWGRKEKDAPEPSGLVYHEVAVSIPFFLDVMREHLDVADFVHRNLFHQLQELRLIQSRLSKAAIQRKFGQSLRAAMSPEEMVRLAMRIAQIQPGDFPSLVHYLQAEEGTDFGSPQSLLHAVEEMASACGNLLTVMSESDIFAGRKTSLESYKSAIAEAVPGLVENPDDLLDPEFIEELYECTGIDPMRVPFNELDDAIPRAVRIEGKREKVKAAAHGKTCDLSAFVPAVILYQLRGMTALQCNKCLKKNPRIRRRSLRANRLLIHAGDWLTYWHQKDKLDAQETAASGNS